MKINAVSALMPRPLVFTTDGMKILVVLAHPLPDSLSARFALYTAQTLTAAGHHVTLKDLYTDGFSPVLTTEERRAYYSAKFEDTAGLTELDGLILVFPTWWFGLPAILKGWIDRNFLPGVAYDHAQNLGALTPRLTRLQQVVAITTLGAPRVIDWALLRRPVYRMLKWGVFKACAPKARYRMHSLYRAETVTPKRLEQFEERLKKTLHTAFGTADE